MLQDKLVNFFCYSGWQGQNNKLTNSKQEGKEAFEDMSHVKGARRIPKIVALERELLKKLKDISSKRGASYQVLMRLLIDQGVKRLKDAT